MKPLKAHGSRIASYSAGILLAAAPLFAQDSVADLKLQIQTLQDRVAQLESSLQNQTGQPLLQHPGSSGMTPQLNPFAELSRMQAEMKRMFQNSFDFPGLPAAGILKNDMFFENESNLEETKDAYIVTFHVQGLDKKNINIDVKDHSVSISGEQRNETKQDKDNQYLASRAYSSFLQTIPLPADADTTKVETKREGDNLVVSVPKK